MRTELKSGVKGSGGMDSVRTLSTMNLITLSWLVASGLTPDLPGTRGDRCLDATVQRRGQECGHVQ